MVSFYIFYVFIFFGRETFGGQIVHATDVWAKDHNRSHRRSGPPLFWNVRTDPHFISTPSQKFSFVPHFSDQSYATDRNLTLLLPKRQSPMWFVAETSVYDRFHFHSQPLPVVRVEQKNR